MEYFHSKNFLHRDVKPDNFLMGKGKKRWLIYIIDYGLAKRYKDPRTGEHIKYHDDKEFTGTARYASLNTHLGIDQSRRDDLEGIAYSAIYFLKGSLPWQGLRAKDKKEKYSKIRDIKVSLSPEDLCDNLPFEFTTFLNYCRLLKFEQEPDYNYVRKLFKNLFIEEGFNCDYMYDWMNMRMASKSLACVMIDSHQLIHDNANHNKEFQEEIKEKPLIIIDSIDDDEKPQAIRQSIIKPRIDCSGRLIKKPYSLMNTNSLRLTPNKLRNFPVINFKYAKPL